MTETQEEKTSSLPVLTTDSAKAQMSIALTKTGLLVQSLHDRRGALVLNEDPENLEIISKFISDKKKAKKVIEEEHAIIKKPYLEGGKAADKGKNEMIALIDDPSLEVENWYNKTLNDIDRKKKEAEQKKQRDEQTKNGIESNILSFSTQIAACKTRKQLTDVERLINLEKSSTRASKYGEWHQFAIDRYDTVLMPILKDQKVKVDEYEALQEKLSKEDNPEAADKLKTQLENKENEILQNQVKVQEQALNQQQIPSSEVEEVLPDITKAGSNMTCEIVDLKTALKKHPELLKIELNLSEAKKIGATLRDSGAFKGGEELIFDGIKFKIEKRWR